MNHAATHSPGDIGRASLWTGPAAERATGGHSTAPWTATGVSLDSRSLRPGDLFVAVQGPNHDGHDYLDAAFKAGAAAAMVSRIPANHGTRRPLLIVDDTYCGLRQLAREARRRTEARIIAVTGSVGKTSTKEALGAALEPSGPTTVSRGNLNNRWGVPLSLARMPAHSAFGVFEIGMNHADEITPLSRLVVPEIAIITTVEAVHLEFFDSVEGIARAKAEIFDGLSRDGTAVLNRDNQWFDLLTAEARRRGISRIIGFGTDPQSDAQLLSCDDEGGHSRIRAEIMGQPLDFILGLPGRHSAMNAMAVLAAVKLAGADVEAATRALGEMSAPAGRGRMLEAALPGGGGIRIIDDTYNASPASMRAAFRVLAAMRPQGGGRRIAVLGDMLELGTGSARAHAALADDIQEAGVERVFTTGANMIHLDDALPRALRGGHGADSNALLSLLRNQLRPGDIVLVKASNSQNLGRLVRALTTPAAESGPTKGGR